jgi:hypothetical protein
MYCLFSLELQILITPVVSSNFWEMNCLFSIQFQIIITPVVIFKLLVNVLSVLPSVTDSNYPCGVFKLLVNVLSVLP